MATCRVCGWNTLTITIIDNTKAWACVNAKCHKCLGVHFNDDNGASLWQKNKKFRAAFTSLSLAIRNMQHNRDRAGQLYTSDPPPSEAVVEAMNELTAKRMNQIEAEQFFDDLSQNDLVFNEEAAEQQRSHPDEAEVSDLNLVFFFKTQSGYFFGLEGAGLHGGCILPPRTPEAFTAKEKKQLQCVPYIANASGACALTDDL